MFLDFRKSTAYIGLRTRQEIKEILEKAAALQGCSLSDFIFDSCLEKAQRIVDAEEAKLKKAPVQPKTKQP